MKVTHHNPASLIDLCSDYGYKVPSHIEPTCPTDTAKAQYLEQYLYEDESLLEDAEGSGFISTDL